MGISFRPVEVVREYCAKYPAAPTKTLARRILQDHPQLYKNLTCCYKAVARVFGVHGEEARSLKSTEARSLHRPKREAGWDIGFPEGITHHKDWTPYVLDARRIGIMSDIHAPYHCGKEVVRAIKQCVADRCDAIVLNGDICDFYVGSKFVTDPRKRDFLEEREAVCDILSRIRRALPRAKIIFKKGNHEERWFRYICTAAPDMLDLPELSLESLFRLKDYKVSMIPDRRAIACGTYNIIHGHELGNIYSNPVGASRAYWTRTVCNTIVGHLHRIDTYSSISPVTRQKLTVYSSGCLCDIYPDYAPMNGWEHGFTRMDVAKSGKTTVKNLRNDEL